MIPLITRTFHLRSRSLSWADASSSFYRRHIVFSTNWTSVMHNLHMLAKNDGTNEDMHAANRVLVTHRYNCSDNPINVARKKLFENSATTRLANLAISPQPKMLQTYTHYMPIIQDGMGNPLDPVLYCCKGIQGALHPILTTLKPAPESLMEIKLCRCPTN